MCLLFFNFTLNLSFSKVHLFSPLRRFLHDLTSVLGRPCPCVNDFSGGGAAFASSQNPNNCWIFVCRRTFGAERFCTREK